MKLSILAIFTTSTLAFAVGLPSEWKLSKEVASFDKNGDNLISPQEINEDLKIYDINNDNYVTVSESRFVSAKIASEKKNPNYKTPDDLQNSQNKKINNLKTKKNIILISIDGADRFFINKLLNENKLPNLKEILNEGSGVTLQIKGCVTSTKPTHAAMLTGIVSEQNLVMSNSDFNPIPQNYTIFERAKQKNPDLKTIFISSKIDNVGGEPPAKNGKNNGGPYYLSRKNIDVFSAKDRHSDESTEAFLKNISDIATEKSENQNLRFFAFYHFRNPDSEGHKYGRESKEYSDIIIKIDSHIGDIVKSLKYNNLYDETFLIVTADHGFDPNGKNHTFAPDTWLISNVALLNTKGTNYDVPATILDFFNVDMSSEPNLVGKSLIKNKN